MRIADVDIYGNIEVNRKEGYITISVNPKFYSIGVVFAAAYVFLDRAYIIIDGDPEKEIVIEMRPKKEGENLGQFGMEFNNELLNYANYQKQVERNGDIRTAIIQRALLTNDVDFHVVDSAEKSYIDDPDGIAIPWGEKHAKGGKKIKHGSGKNR